MKLAWGFTSASQIRPHYRASIDRQYTMELINNTSVWIINWVIRYCRTLNWANSKLFQGLAASRGNAVGGHCIYPRYNWIDLNQHTPRKYPYVVCLLCSSACVYKPPLLCVQTAVMHWFHCAVSNKLYHVLFDWKMTNNNFTGMIYAIMQAPKIMSIFWCFFLCVVFLSDGVLQMLYFC